MLVISVTLCKLPPKIYELILQLLIIKKSAVVGIVKDISAGLVQVNKNIQTVLFAPVYAVFDEAGDVVSVRPSGTEPKIKFYFGAKGADAEEKIALLKAQFVN